MSGLDGYLAALIIGPRLIDPRQWIQELTGAEALNMPMATTADKPCRSSLRDITGSRRASQKHLRCHRPRFSRSGDKTFDTMDWHVSFLMGTGFSTWRPISRGHAVTGDIIAPIRKLSEATGPSTRRMSQQSPKHSSRSAATSCQSGQTEVLKKRCRHSVNVALTVS
ncbi:UPF0149 family protein [Rhizobium gallicum]|uniref:UPF0149 family protein n=1 Tax=Rhizobium gallicum TaxID=56730 RepID=UPI003B8A97C4